MNPLLLEIPEIIETPRLWLKAPAPSDAPHLFEGINATFEHLKPFMAWAQTRPTREDCEATARRFVSDWILREHLDYRIWIKETNQFAGCCGLHTFDWNVPRGEIGYWLHRDMQGQGYMVEAVETLRDFALETLKFKRLEIRCASHNTKSAAVAKRAGFEFVARMENTWRGWDGHLKHSMIFSITRPEEISKETPEEFPQEEPTP